MKGFLVATIAVFVGLGGGAIVGYFVLTSVLSLMGIYGEGVGLVGIASGALGGLAVVFRLAEKLRLVD